MDKNAITQVEYNDQIIQVKLLNVEKNSLFVGSIFQEISKNGVNIDMISQVMLEDEMRIDFTCDQKDQEKLNEAIENIKQKHPRIMVYQSRNVAKVMVEGEKMKDEIGVAAHIFEILGKYQVPLLQITTSEISISCVIPSEFMELAVSEIKKAYQL
ncbi:MAG: ACT domain-containing protein [Coprobacillus cateniformis]|uniref:ACT domain-containing protein n=1 Tax=Longibaculum muris TaxID=1796628 RepID=UPI003AB3EAA9|nr:ACT domain-containing protein [Coprobacillus cateniformis]